MSWEYLKEIDTPGMQQYVSFKSERTDSFIFFQIGDFYEVYGEDAEQVSKILGLKLTSKNFKQGVVPMCGVPISSGNDYASQLARSGKKVVLVIQKKNENDEVQRVVGNIITPATIQEETYLSEDEHNYLMTAYQLKNEWGVACLDTLSGEIFTQTCEEYAIFDLVERYQPKETRAYMIKEWDLEWMEQFHRCNIETFVLPYFYEEMKPVIESHKEQHFSNQFIPYAVIAAHYFLLDYLQTIQHQTVTLRPIRHVESRNHLYLHQNALAGLEIFENQQKRKKEGSLYHLLDRCTTPKGKRLLRTWLQEPLLEPKEIIKRQNIVAMFLTKKEFREVLQNILKQTTDCERTLGRIETQNFKEYELVALKNDVQHYLEFFEITIRDSKNSALIKASEKIIEKIEKIQQEIDRRIDFIEIVAKGYHENYDQIREKKENGKNEIETYHKKESQKAEINNLSLEENNVLGYFFKVTKTQLEKVPEHFVEKMKMKDGSVRYVTETLKTLEMEYYEALEQHDSLRKKVVRSIGLDLQSLFPILRKIIDYIATLDVLMGFAEVAEQYHYERPEISDKQVLSIYNGKHPLLQAYGYRSVVPNQCSLNEKEIILISGPNAGGKTVYLKMVALFMLMAQVGSYVPGKMYFSPVDRILLRIGANDALLERQSTFMMEMKEMAYITRVATSNSLIVIDELGRGTSTSDGISIAEAVLEYIHEKIKAKTLCSTHYHELIQLESKLPRLKNYHAEVIEKESDIDLTYRILPGGSEKSFGIHVAKMVGLPQEIVSQAETFLQEKYS